MAVKKAKKARTYDAKARIERARQGRERLIEVARRAFLNQGYAATTVVEIANEAAVSVETIYKTFGGKTGLVRAIYERGLAGRELISAPARSDAISASEANPSALARKWGTLTAEVAPLVAPILLLIRTAAVSNPELLPLLAEADTQRLKRMAANAAVLAKRGFLDAGVSRKNARDVMWACTSPELYELLVLRRGWTAAQFGEFVAATLEAALLRRS